jgi:hypothetical protein
LHSVGIVMSLVSASCLAIALLVPSRDEPSVSHATGDAGAPLRPLFDTASHAGDRAGGRGVRVAATRFAAGIRNFAWSRRGSVERDVTHSNGVPRDDASRDDVAPDDVAPDDFERAVSSYALPDVIGDEPDAHAPQGVSPMAAPAPPSPPVAAAGIPAVTASEPPKATIATGTPPLTRLPLRSLHEAVTWPASFAAGLEPWSEAKRHEFLRHSAGSDQPALVSALCLAYREENQAGRLLALRALRGRRDPSARELFVDALRRGTDDERATAVDALEVAGERDALVEALSDRVDAVAARAALAYVGLRPRADFERLLEPLVDGERRAAILGLLGAVLE